VPTDLASERAIKIQARGSDPRRNRPPALAHHTISPEAPPIAERLNDLLGSRDLFLLLVSRELQLRYKQTALGAVWVVLQPLIPALILTVVFGTFARLPSNGAPYLLFVLSGFVLYGLVAGGISRAGSSLVRDGQLIAKVYVPRALLPLAGGAAALVDFFVGLVVLGVIIVGFGKPLTLALLLVPIIAALALTFALAIGLAVAALSANYRDFGHVVPFGLQLLLYASPIAYSLEILPRSLYDVVGLNPLVPLVEAFRWTLLGTPPPSAIHMLFGSIVGVLLVIAGVYVYMHASRDLADVI
jgi:lipopolysaccharide transport system permease protein